MTLLNEINYLIKMLFNSKPKTINELEIVEMEHFPFSGYLAMSWCGKLITKDKNKIDEVTKRHETIHLKQAQQHSSWTSYYIRYLIEWFKGKPFKKPYNNSAYYTIPFEVEAYANENKEGYEVNYDKDNLKIKYTFKNRKELFQNFKNLSEWKKYIKSL